MPRFDASEVAIGPFFSIVNQRGAFDASEVAIGPLVMSTDTKAGKHQYIALPDVHPVVSDFRPDESTMAAGARYIQRIQVLYALKSTGSPLEGHIASNSFSCGM